MPVSPTYPGVYVQEMPGKSRAIPGVATSIAAFVDCFERGPVDEPVHVRSFDDFEREFGGLSATSEASYGVSQFFLNGGLDAWIVRTATGEPDAAALIGARDRDKSGMFALDDVDLFNILCLPRAAELYEEDSQQMHAVISAAEAYCEERRAFLIIDIPPSVSSAEKATDWLEDMADLRHRNAAAYVPRLRIPDPLSETGLRNVGASGTMAGIYARTDAARGVWKAPAGNEASLRNVPNLDFRFTDDENDRVNRRGLNALREMSSYGNVSWGARTLDGADERSSDWRYIPVRRTALFIEQSIYNGTQWAVFEPNDEPLWAELRLHIGAFMNSLFRQGAFHGSRASDAYFVKVDHETTTQADIALGVVNILIGFAPLKPAEFVIIRFGQKAGQRQI